MAPSERTYVWEWWFDAPPSRVWPVVADTNRLDRLAGLPPATYTPATASGRDGFFDVRQKAFGFVSLSYDEEPYEWVEGERVAVRRVAILFTDLESSTALYRRIGDAAAYALVREHFRVLADAVRRHDGLVVKTIGDAVMASFRTPADAVSAALDMHRAISAMPVPDGCDRLVLKAGVNQGPSIVVNSGGLLDFFGMTTNFAARAQHESAGGDVVVTDAVSADEDVRRVLASVAHRVEPFRATLKGIEGQVPLQRVVLT